MLHYSTLSDTKAGAHEIVVNKNFIFTVVNKNFVINNSKHGHYYFIKKVNKMLNKSQNKH